MAEREIENTSNSKENKLGQPPTSVGTAEEPRGVLNSDWLVNQIVNYAKTGELEVSPNEGFYLDTKDNYYSDPEVRKALKAEFGTDDPRAFAAHFATLRKNYLKQTESAHLDSRNITGAMMQRYNTEAGQDSELLPSPSFNQMRYDDGRLRVGDQTYRHEYSHRQGKTRKVVTESGELVYTTGFEDIDALKADPRFRNKEGQAPIAFKYQGDQMYEDSMGGSMVPVYDHEYQGEMIVSNYDIEGTTRIYKDSHSWNALAKTPINFLVSAFDQSIVGTMKEIGYIIHGDDAENWDYVTYLNNLSNRLKAAKFSGSDAADSIYSMEGAVTMISEVAYQILAMVGTGKLGAMGLKRMGFSPGVAEQTAAYMARLGMTTYAATTVGDQGRALGLSKRESAVAAFSAMGVLWASNSLFNWVEGSIVQNKAIKSGLEKAVSSRMAAYASGSRNLVSNVEAGEGIGRQMISVLKKTFKNLQPSANNVSKPMQIAQGSVGETFQESFEFLGEELVKNVSNMYRYYVGDYEENPEEFKGYKWVAEKDYFSKYFVPGLGQSALGGFVGGGIARPMMGFDPKIADMMTYSIVNGREDVFRKVVDQYKKKMVFGDPSLSTIPDADGAFLTIQEAREVDADPIDQNTYNLHIIENEFNFKLKTLQALGLRGAGSHEYKKILEKTPEIKDIINTYEIGSILKSSYEEIAELMPKGVNNREVVEIVEGVARISKEYENNFRSAENVEEEEKAVEAKNDATEEMVTGLTEESKLTLVDAQNIVKATQRIHDVLNGKHAEQIFIKTLYQFDKSLSPQERVFTPLDGTKNLESIDGIFSRQNALSEAREFNKNKAIRDFKAFEFNAEVVKGKGTLSEKFDKLKRIGDKIFISDESLKELSSSMDLKPIKKALKDAVDAITPQLYGELSPVYNMILNVTDQGTLKRQKLNAEAAVFNDIGDGDIEFDAEATLEERRKEFKKEVDALDNFEDIKNLKINILALGMVPLTSATSKLNAKVDELILKPATEAAYIAHPEEGNALAALKKLSDEKKLISGIKAWDDTDISHLLSEYEKNVNGDFIPREGTDLIANVKLLKTDSDDNFNKEIDSTTFDQFDKVEALQKQLIERKALLAFIQESESPIGSFRRSMTEHKMTSFQKQEEFDKELTRFNRVFQRMLYNPARRLELTIKNKEGGLTVQEQEEFNKIELLNQKYTVEILLQIDMALADLDQIMGTKLKQVSTDVAKKAQFKKFVGSIKNDTIEEIEAALGVFENLDAEGITNHIKTINQYQDLFKFKGVDVNDLSDVEANSMMKTVIRAKDILYDSYNGKQADLLTNYKTIESNEEKAASKRLLYSISVPYSEFIGRYKGYVKLDTIDDAAAIFKFPANFAQFKASSEGFAFYVNEDTQDTLKEMLIIDQATSNLSDRDIEALSPTGMLAISGKLGTGKTAFVGSMILKLSTDYLEISDQKALLSAVVQEQVDRLSTSVEKTNTSLYHSKFFIGNNSDGNLITFLEGKREDTLADVSTIVIDEATYINNTEYIKKVSGENMVKDYNGPEFISFNRSMKLINQNRKVVGLPRLRVLMMGDPYQGGSLSVSKDGNPVSVSVFNNQFLPRTTYLREAERSQIKTLNQSISTTLAKARGQLRPLAAPLGLSFGYDATSHDLLGVSVATSMDSLVEENLEGLDKSLADILVEKFEADKGNKDPDTRYTVGIASDVFTSVEDIIQSAPELATLVNNPKYRDRFKVRSHEEIQGAEVSFVIVHIDNEHFRGEFGHRIDTTFHHMTTLATSIGRARFGAVIVNESRYDIESKYISQEKRPPTADVDSVVKSLRDFQIGSFGDIATIDPVNVKSKLKRTPKKKTKKTAPPKIDEKSIIDPLSKPDEVPLTEPKDLTQEEQEVINTDIIRPLILFGHFPKVSPRDYRDYHRHIRTQLGRVLKRDPKGRWKHSFTSGDAQYNILIEIRDDASIRDTAITQAANAMLVYTHKSKSMPNMSVLDFMQKVSKGDDSLQTASQRGTFLRDLDKQGIVALNTETFNAFAGKPVGLSSLIHTAKEVLVPAGFTAAEDGPDYRLISRALLIPTNTKYQATKFVTYVYESPDPKNPATSMMLAAEYNGEMYVIGNFSNISKGQGPNLKTIQSVAKKSLNKNKNIVGVWSPGVMVGQMFNPDKGMTSGRIVKGKGRMTVTEIEEKLKEYNLKGGPIKIITTPGLEHSGKAVMFYSSDLTDDFNNLELLYEEDGKLSLGSLKGSRGMILFDPGHLTLGEFHEKTYGQMDIGPKKGDNNPLIRAMMMNNVNLNLTSAFTELILGYMERFPEHAYFGESGTLAQLKELNAEASMMTWDPKQLQKLIDEIGIIDPGAVPTPQIAAIRALLSVVVEPASWTVYNRGDAGEILQNEADTPRLKFSPNPITYAPADPKNGGYDQTLIEFDIYKFLDVMQQAALAIPVITINGKEVKDTKDKLFAMYTAIDDMLARFENKEFSHGIRILPIIAPKSATGEAIVSDIALADITEFSKEGLTAPVASFEPPLVYIRATVDNINIWDKADYKFKQKAPAKQTALGAVDINGTTIQIDNLLDSTGFKMAMKDAGIEQAFFGIKEEDALLERFDAIQEQLEEEFKGQGLDTQLEEYLNDLGDRVSNKEFVSMTTEQSPAGEVTLNNILGKFAGKDEVIVAEAIKITSGLKFLDAFSGVLMTHADRDQGLELLTNIKQQVLEASFTPAIKTQFNSLAESIEAVYVNAQIDGNITDYELKINDVLATIESIELESLTGMQWVMPQPGDTLSQMMLAYASVPQTIENFKGVRQGIASMIQRRDISMYELVLGLPISPIEDITDIFTTSVIKGDMRITSEKAYKAKQEIFMQELALEVVDGGRTTDPAILDAVEIVGVLMSSKGDPVKNLAALPVVNLFNIHESGLLQTVHEGTVSNVRLDTYFIKQHKELLLAILNDPTILNLLKANLTSLKEDINVSTQSNLELINDAYLGDKASMNAESILQNMVGTFDPAIGKIKLLDTMVTSIMNIQSKKKTAKKPSKSDIKNRLEEQIKNAFYYAERVPSSSSSSASSLLGIMKKNLIPKLGLSKEDSAKLTVKLKNDLLTEPGEDSRIIC